MMASDRRRGEPRGQAPARRPGGKRPITPEEVERAPQRESGRLSATELLERWHELDGRHHHCRAVTALKARGEHDPARHSAESPPLTAGEYLTLIALGEAIARTVRHPAQAHNALEAGATWEQLAAAAGRGEATVRQAYRQWADSQRRLREHYGKWGLTAEEHAEALKRAEG